jgi:hypothetical protein
MTQQELAHILVKAGLITPGQVRAAAMQLGPGKVFADIVTDMGLVSRAAILQIHPAAFDSVEDSAKTGTAIGYIAAR